MSEGEFKRIDEDEGPPPGPLALLLSGFSSEEAGTVSIFLGSLELPEHRVVLCTEPMLAKPLGEALTTTEDDPPVPSDQLPRVIVLSGLTGPQVRVFLDRYASTGLTRPIFATVTPSNRNFTVRDLLIELLREHRAMLERK
jgi:hypothetical protein